MNSALFHTCNKLLYYTIIQTKKRSLFSVGCILFMICCRACALTTNGPSMFTRCGFAISDLGLLAALSCQPLRQHNVAFSDQLFGKVVIVANKTAHTYVRTKIKVRGRCSIKARGWIVRFCCMHARTCM